DLTNSDNFGCSLANIGDIDGDGVVDLAVGAKRDSVGNTIASHGAVYILNLKTDGTAKSSTRISAGAGGGPTLGVLSYFGNAVASLGDLNGDGVTDIGVGVTGDNTGGAGRGAMYVLYM